MSRLLSLLLVLLFVFDVTLVAARPRQFLQHRSPTPVDIASLNTNAKRFGRGMPPLPPLFKRTPTGVDTARRGLTSQCAKKGFIQVINAENNKVKGYVSRDLKANQRYTLVDLSEAGVFSSKVSTSGQTSNINILDANDGNHYLAGLIKKDEQLGNGDGDEKAAILGNSYTTQPGSPPKSNKDASWHIRDAETAIWTYDHTNDRLTASWVNYQGQTPGSTPVYFYWVNNKEEFYLTNSPTTTRGLPVLFKFISVGDKC